ncbi:MAG: reverse transcriptase family protein, partial [Turicibacter sp.]
MSRIKQNDYYFIKDYLDALESAFKRYSICAKISKEEQNRRKEEYFYKGLSVKTKLELERLGLYNMCDIIHKITSLEQKVLELSSFGNKNEPIEKEQKNHLTNINHKNLTFKKTAKYCPYHKSTFHDASECKRKTKSIKEPEKKAMIVTEPVCNLKDFKMQLEIKNKILDAIIDTGASVNLISTEKIKEVGLESSITPEEGSIQYADGTYGKYYGNLQIQFKLVENKAITYNATFKIINSNLDLVILGSPFLKGNNVKLDFSNMSIIINSNIYFIDKEKYEKWNSSPDSSLCDKVLVCNSDEEDVKRIILKRVAQFKNNNPLLGTIPNQKMEIKLNSPNIVQSKPYPIPYALRNAVDLEIDRLLKEKIIRKSRSNYSSPAFPIIKRNKNIRLVVDFRKLNSITLKETFPFPDVLDEIQSITPGNIFSQLDLSSGYHQLELAEESKKYTAFITQKGLFEYNRVPFGLTNAPKVFQRLMHELIGHLKYVKTFLDDILIISQNMYEHSSHVNQVLDILEANNISV